MHDNPLSLFIIGQPIALTLRKRKKEEERNSMSKVHQIKGWPRQITTTKTVVILIMI
jgi:hypothetical protein